MNRFRSLCMIYCSYLDRPLPPNIALLESQNYFAEGRLVKKALRKLIREGYARMHPTRGEMTYELTREKLKPAVR